MADFAATLRNTLAKLGDASPEIRQKVYDKARDAITRKIEALPSAPPQAAIDRQYAKLDAAIEEVEADYTSVVEEAVDALQDAIGLDDAVVPEAPVEETVETVEAVTDHEQPVAHEDQTAEPDIDEPVYEEPASVEEVDPTAEADHDDVPAFPEPEPVAHEEIATETVFDDTSHDDTIIEDESVFDDYDDPETETVYEPAPVAPFGGNVFRYGTTRLPEEQADAPEPEFDPSIFDDEPADHVDETPSFDDEKDPLEAFLEEQDQAALREDEARLDGGELDEATLGETPDEAIVPPLDDTTQQEPKKSKLGLIVTLTIIAALAAGAVYAALTYQDEIMGLLNPETAQEDGVPVRTAPTTTVTADETEADDSTATDTPAEQNVASATNGDETEKFTQRLEVDGTEVDEGPGGAQQTTGEGSSVAPQTPGTAPADGNADALSVGQRAVFYEERTGTQSGTSFPGAAIWSVVQEAPASGMEPEPAIRAEASVPELGLVMEMLIKRNGDETLPASHLIEVFFRVPGTFEGRGIADLQRITLKETESDPGSALIAVPAPLDTNIFMVALNSADTAVQTNLALLNEQQWIDVPMQYISGRRALITLEKGSAGQEVFDEVLGYWAANPVGQPPQSQ